MKAWMSSLRLSIARAIAPSGTTLVPSLRLRPPPWAGIAQTPPTASLDVSKARLLITGCSDPWMWYALKVGQYVPYVGTWPEGYKSREDSGHINIVKFEDAVLVHLP